VSPGRFRKIAERAAEDAEQGDPRARQWLSDPLVGRRASTPMMLTMTEEYDLIDFRDLTNDEFTEFGNLYDRIWSGDDLSANDAQVFVRLMAKSCASAERIEKLDGEGDI